MGVPSSGHGATYGVARLPADFFTPTRAILVSSARQTQPLGLTGALLPCHATGMLCSCSKQPDALQHLAHSIQGTGCRASWDDPSKGTCTDVFILSKDGDMMTQHTTYHRNSNKQKTRYKTTWEKR